MKYLVTLKRKQTTNAVQNARKIRCEVTASNEANAKHAALEHYGKYFTVDSVRRA